MADKDPIIPQGSMNSLFGFYGNPEPAPQVPDIKPPSGQQTGVQSPIRRFPGLWGTGWGGETGNAWLSTVYGGLNGGIGYSGAGWLGTWSGYPIDVLAGGGLYGWGANGFTQPRRGFYSTYRLMNLHPTINLVKALILQPILTSTWNFKKKNEDVPDEWMKEISDQLTPLRWDIMQNAVDYLTFGWQPFEKVWAIENGRYKIKWLKPLLQDITFILHDGFGGFGGLTQNGSTMPNPLLPDKTLVLTYNGKAGNFYGLSRHENAFEAWVDWQQIRLKRMQLLAKVSGIIPILKFKPGQTPVMMPDGTMGQPLNNSEIARQMLATLGMGNGVALPCVEYEDSELAANPALAKVTPWELDFYDAGSYSTAIEGYIKCFQYEDQQLFQAWSKPARTGLESQHAARADSKTHTESSSVDSEMIDDDIAYQLSKMLVDDILVLNFGEKARGSVYIKPAPLVDKKVDIFMAALNGIMADPQLARTFVRGINMDDLASHLDISTNGDLNADFEKPMADELGGAGDFGGGLGLPSTIKTGRKGAQSGNRNGSGRRTVGKPAPPNAVTKMSRISRMLEGLNGEE